MLRIKEDNPASSGMHDPNAAREKADYKRFFSVANKHLVFYSENNGFYKYMVQSSSMQNHMRAQRIMEQVYIFNILAHIASLYMVILQIRHGHDHHVRIHLHHQRYQLFFTDIVASDPGIAFCFLKKYVYLFHYPLSTHMVLHTGALDHYDTILCVGEFQIPEIRKQEELYHLPEKKLIMCGYGQLEKLQKQYDAMEPPVRTCRKILVAPSWQEDNILDSCIDDLLRELMGKGNHIVVRPHPEYVKRYGKRMENVVSRYADYTGDDLEFELDFTSIEGCQ